MQIFRKAAFRLVSEDIASEQQPIVVNSGNLKDFVGREKFTNERMYETTPPGVIMGLAWTAMGGSPYLYVFIGIFPTNPSNFLQAVRHSTSRPRWPENCVHLSASQLPAALKPSRQSPVVKMWSPASRSSSIRRPAVWRRPAIWAM